MSDAEYPGVVQGEGYAVAHIDDLGERYGFRKIRKGMGVTAFGINAVVLPPGYETGRHFHEQQEETYFLHSGEIEMEFGENGEIHRMRPGSVARVDPSTIRKVRNVSESEDAVYVVAGGKDGYVGRDGQLAEGETSRSHPVDKSGA